ncbi:hypothetical protein IFM47457_02245 [Aspergillus lentulus]|nr:hypothetical protein IFM47457_02245 [Aspergillus lentulus]
MHCQPDLVGLDAAVDAHHTWLAILPVLWLSSQPVISVNLVVSETRAGDIAISAPAGFPLRMARCLHVQHGWSLDVLSLVLLSMLDSRESVRDYGKVSNIAMMK